MIVRFSVANYLSFNELTDFNMVSGDIRTKKNHIESINGVELLKFSLLYGANGAGKSNLIKALEAMVDVVQSGTVDGVSDNKHKLDETCLHKPTEFEIEFISASNTAYIYGLSILNNTIENEYLYVSGLSRVKDKLVFERHSAPNNKSKIELANKFLSIKKDINFVELMENSLLEKNHVALTRFIEFPNVLEKFQTEIEQVVDWFIFNIIIIHPASQPQKLVYNLSMDEDFLNFSNQLLSTIDAGLKSLKIEKFKLDDFFGETDDDKKFIDEIKKDLEEEDFLRLNVDLIAVKDENNSGEYLIKKLFTEHHGNSGDVTFSIFEESDGTKRLIEYLSLVYEILNPKLRVVYLVDEMERSIHPYLLKEILKKVVNTKNITGQLIFTTHESNLMDLDLFRPDEIWLTEKNSNGETNFTPLSDFKIRNDLDIKNGYFKGRFGAIPILANFKDLNWGEHAN
jgi:hypothetical protein